MDLQGKVAVVTGAGQGLGREISLRYAREGAAVVLASRSRERLEATQDEIEALGGRALVWPTDVTDAEQVAALEHATRETLGPADVVVCNSGVPGPTADLWEVSPEQWEETMRVNVSGTFLVCRAFLPAMVERNRGSVVVIGSMTGKRPMRGRTPYAASKMALVGLVRTLALEAGPYGVRVNLISPGPVEGERLDRVIANTAAATGGSAEQARKVLTAGSALKRLTTPASVADAALFLASEAAELITGEDLNVSGGFVMY